MLVAGGGEECMSPFRLRRISLFPFLKCKKLTTLPVTVIRCFLKCNLSLFGCVIRELISHLSTWISVKSDDGKSLM